MVSCRPRCGAAVPVSGARSSSLRERTFASERKSYAASSRTRSRHAAGPRRWMDLSSKTAGDCKDRVGCRCLATRWPEASIGPDKRESTESEQIARDVVAEVRPRIRANAPAGCHIRLDMIRAECSAGAPADARPGICEDVVGRIVATIEPCGFQLRSIEVDPIEELVASVRCGHANRGGEC